VIECSKGDAIVADFVIKSGDMIKVTIAPPALVPTLQAPVSLSGSGSTISVNGSPVCLEGDELPPALRAPMPYTAPPFTNPGSGKLSVTLTPGNKTQTTDNGKPILIKGSKFTALFTVEIPATQTTPSGPVPDMVLTKNGTAEFITTNVSIAAG